MQKWSWWKLSGIEGIKLLQNVQIEKLALSNNWSQQITAINSKEYKY